MAIDSSIEKDTKMTLRLRERAKRLNNKKMLQAQLRAAIKYAMAIRVLCFLRKTLTETLIS